MSCEGGRKREIGGAPSDDEENEKQTETKNLNSISDFPGGRKCKR